TIWKVATSSKKNSGPAAREIDQIVLLLGVAAVPQSKQFYVDRGLTVAKSFAHAYVEFATMGIKLGLYKHRSMANDAGVSPEGSGSHAIVIVSDAGAFADPDGFAWEAAEVQAGQRTGIPTAASPTPQSS